VVSLRGGEYSIGALTRQGEAHEYLATQESRIATLIVVPAAQQRQVAAATAQLDRAEAAANRLPEGNPQRDTILQRVQEGRDRLVQQQEEQNRVVQASFDAEAEAERKLAIINYGTAVYTSRNQNIPTPYSARALEHMRLDENRPLVDSALSQQRVFEYRSGMFDGEAPGATVSQTTPMGGPGLVSE
jgi:hypothetical protein